MLIQYLHLSIQCIIQVDLKGCNIRGSARNIQVYSLWPYRMHSYKAIKYLRNYFRILSLYVAGSYCFFTQTSKSEFSLRWGWMYPAGIPADEQQRVFHPEAACKLGRPVSPVSSNILYPSAGQGASKAITIIRAFPSLE